MTRGHLGAPPPHTLRKNEKRTDYKGPGVVTILHRFIASICRNLQKCSGNEDHESQILDFLYQNRTVGSSGWFFIELVETWDPSYFLQPNSLNLLPMSPISLGSQMHTCTTCICALTRSRLRIAGYFAMTYKTTCSN